MRHITIVFLLLLVVGMAITPRAEARTMLGTAHVVILDADTMQPVEGASVAFLGTDKSWPLPPGEAEKVTFYPSDKAGLVNGRAPVGRSSSSWAPVVGFRTKEKWAPALLLHVEKSGYKPLTAVTAWAEQTVYLPKIDVYLGNVLLAKTDSQKDSGMSEESIRAASAEVIPPYGVAGRSFEIRIEITHPKSLERVLGDKPGNVLSVKVSSTGLWKGDIGLGYVEPKPGEPPKGFVCAGMVKSLADTKPGVYPIDARVLLKRADPILLPGVIHLAIGATDEEAKATYEKNK